MFLRDSPLIYSGQRFFCRQTSANGHTGHTEGNQLVVSPLMILSAAFAVSSLLVHSHYSEAHSDLYSGLCSDLCLCTILFAAFAVSLLLYNSRHSESHSGLYSDLCSGSCSGSCSGAYLEKRTNISSRMFKEHCLHHYEIMSLQVLILMKWSSFIPKISYPITLIPHKSLVFTSNKLWSFNSSAVYFISLCIKIKNRMKNT